jgi:hypothetical protein
VAGGRLEDYEGRRLGREVGEQRADAGVVVGETALFSLEVARSSVFLVTAMPACIGPS